MLKIIPVSRATWYEGVKTGRFPAQVKLGPASPRGDAVTLTA
ncbi:helix-turn-helix transcriptional regulator [Burkholderia pseudomallei]|nr:AlpA family phage regulatory protein [Burkholderia pseudomallei]